jgi:single-stranded-DNA-specific exonuclease
MTPAPARQRLAKKWILRPLDKRVASDLANELNLSPIVAGLLTARGYTDRTTAERFLKPSLEHLHDPFLMKGMPEAVNRLLRAIDHQEPVLIYGDYDVDGTTGTAVLLRALRMLGATAGYHVPHRFTEGYGIQQAVSIAVFARMNPSFGRKKTLSTSSSPITICPMKIKAPRPRLRS